MPLMMALVMWLIHGAVAYNVSVNISARDSMSGSLRE